MQSEVLMILQHLYCLMMSTFCHTLHILQKFAEKPKGKELDAMKVDTTVLGVLLLSLPMHCMLCYW